MKNKKGYFANFVLCLSLLLIFVSSCKKDKNIPVLSTESISGIMQTIAISGGNISYNGGIELAGRGVCWATSMNPTIVNNKTKDGTGTGSFISNITDLIANTTYHIRAYATNDEGTGYGNNLSFMTVEPLNDSVFTDARDGITYQTLKFANQVWLVENLKYLPSVVPYTTSSEISPHHYVYDYNGSNIINAKATANYSEYGVLYNWEAAKLSAPAGWHLPTSEEWIELENYLVNNGHNYDGTNGGGGDKIAKSMANASGWTSSSNSGAVGNIDFNQYRNKSGFSGLPGGLSFELGFGEIGNHGFWWTATPETGNGIVAIAMYDIFSIVINSNGLKSTGFSVRCVRD